MSLTPTAIREYDRDAPDGDATGTATFALGCFWGPDAQFGATAGVVRTRVGYAGGTGPEPTYHALGDHSEAVQVEYDPGELAYADLLGLAFRIHDPHSQPRKVQYQNAVFYRTPEERAAIREFLEGEGLDPGEIGTRIERLDQFHPAESYHQKYSLSATPSLSRPFEEAYDGTAIRESPAAAKVNGYAAGHDLTGDLGRILDAGHPSGRRG